MEVETKMVYNQIKAAGNEGIWTKVLKHKTSLHQQVITRCLKTLEQKQMIKSIKHVKVCSLVRWMFWGFVVVVWVCRCDFISFIYLFF